MKRLKPGQYQVGNLFITRLIVKYPKKRIEWVVCTSLALPGIDGDDFLGEYKTLKDARRAVLKGKLYG